MSSRRPAPAPAPAPAFGSRSNPIARALLGWLESAAPLAPGAGHAAGLACCGGAAAPAETASRARRRIDSWIAK